jgi:hypothetical protein
LINLQLGFIEHIHLSLGNCPNLTALLLATRQSKPRVVKKTILDFIPENEEVMYEAAQEKDKNLDRFSSLSLSSMFCNHRDRRACQNDANEKGIYSTFTME